MSAEKIPSWRADRIHGTTLVCLTCEVRGLEAKLKETQDNYSFMVRRAADGIIDGYREFGARAADAETRAEDLRLALIGMQHAWIQVGERSMHQLRKDMDEAYVVAEKALHPQPAEQAAQGGGDE